MAHDVFISYSSKDKITADAICHVLEQNGVRCWIAPRDIPPGANYGGEIIRGIKDCKVFLLIFSKDSNASPAVAKEVERAILGYRKTVIPFRINDVAMSENLEFFLTDVHWLDAYPNDNVFGNLVTAVINALGISAEPVPAEPVTPAPPKPAKAKKPLTLTKKAKTILAAALSLALVVGLVFGGIALWGGNGGSRISKSVAVGDVVTFGDYEWLVLDVQDGKALILSDKTLEIMAYHSEDVDITWADCSLREYLNGEFYNNTFSTAEKVRIIETELKNKANNYFGTKGGANTKDKVFLLSIEEVEKYFGDSGQLESKNAEYYRQTQLWLLR